MKNIYITNYRMKRNILNLFFTMTLIIILSVTLFKTVSNAKQEPLNEGKKYFTQVEVQYGEDLSVIADRYYSEAFQSKSAYIQEIRNINSLYSSEISPGSYLIIPYYDDIKK